MKKIKKYLDALCFLLWEKPGGNRDGNNIVKGVSSGGNSEASNRKKNCKINSCHCSKSEPCQIKGVCGVWLPAEKIYMVVCAKQRR